MTNFGLTLTDFEQALSKIGHHSRKQSDLKIDAIKNANKKKCAPKLIKASTI